jgi:hypothetical protein
MLPKEIYVGQDGILYKITRLSENPTFFRYEELSQKEISNLVSLLHNNNTRRKGQAGSTGDQTTEPAADDRVRTDTGVYGGDYLQSA